MPSISGSVSGITRPLVARRISKDGQPRNEQTMQPPTGSYTFSTEDGDKIEIVEVSSDTPQDAQGAPA